MSPRPCCRCLHRCLLEGSTMSADTSGAAAASGPRRRARRPGSGAPPKSAEDRRQLAEDPDVGELVHEAYLLVQDRFGDTRPWTQLVEALPAQVRAELPGDTVRQATSYLSEQFNTRACQSKGP